MKRILVVEDDPEIRLNIEAILRMNDYEVLSASNGSIGLELSLQHIPDLIISDVIMPCLDGFGLLKELKKHSETINIPFLFLTAKIETQDFRQGMNLGADDYITKPFNLDEFIHAVKTRLDKQDLNKKIYSRNVDYLRKSLTQAVPLAISRPIDDIIELSEHMHDKYNEISSTTAIDMLNSLKKSAKKLKDIFEKYRLFASLEFVLSSPEDIKNLKSCSTDSAAEIVYSVVDQLSSKYNRTDDISISIKEAQLSMEKEHFRILTYEILDNALKFSDPGTEIIVKSSVNNDGYNMIITNYGPGMTQKQINNIGAYIQFLQKDKHHGGIGLGLAVVNHIIEIFGGNINIESETDYFTSVNVVLPVSN